MAPENTFPVEVSGSLASGLLLLVSWNPYGSVPRI